jgi:anthranilate synthase/aminodeoxychorismate synthase-like glutamine amidotransferase
MGSAARGAAVRRGRPRVTLIDNYDSFTYNLVQYLGELGADVRVHRNDAVTVAALRREGPSHLVISPGPRTPRHAGVSNEAIAAFEGKVPVLGVCLGHQCVAHVHGGKVGRADRLLHGKTSRIIHSGKSIFRGLRNPFEATRYHSLIVRREKLPKTLQVVAWTADDEIMAIQHLELPVWGVQFHPESILTTEGKALLKNFLSY